MSGYLERLLEQATPGPWGIAWNLAHEEARVVGQGGSQGDVTAFCDGRRNLAYKSNAALIARAPDTTRLLIQMAAYIERCGVSAQQAALLARFAALDTDPDDV